MRAVLISLLLIVTSKSVLANFYLGANHKVESLSLTVNSVPLDYELESILNDSHGHSKWNKNYNNLNRVNRNEMLTFLRDYLNGDEYYSIKVSGEITHFVHIEDLVDLFIHFGDKYKLDSRFVLALHVSETSLSNYTTLNNPGNVGNDDYGKRKEFDTLDEGFEAMFVSLADFAKGKKWSFNSLPQDSLAKINYHLIKHDNNQALYPAYYMSNAKAPKTIIRLAKLMGWSDFNEKTKFNLT